MVSSNNELMTNIFYKISANIFIFIHIYLPYFMGLYYNCVYNNNM